jgi:hypothetical protein
MNKIYNRRSLSVGSKVKITAIRTGVDIKNIPYWKFYIPFTMTINGNSIVYKHLWCRVNGKPTFKENDWVVITNIIGYSSNCRHNDNGGMTVFEDLLVEIEKARLEVGEYDNDTY